MVRDHKQRVPEFVRMAITGCMTAGAGVCQTAATTALLTITHQVEQDPVTLLTVLITLLPARLPQHTDIRLEIMAILALPIHIALLATMVRRQLITPPPLQAALCPVQDPGPLLTVNVHPAIIG